jgi:hypothetical protein
MFAVFGDKGEPLDALTIIVKLPISAGMIEHLYFVRESRGWYKQHNWVIAHFGPDDDILAEMETLRGWLKQSCLAVAPKKLARLIASADPRLGSANQSKEPTFRQSRRKRDLPA